MSNIRKKLSKKMISNMAYDIAKEIRKRGIEDTRIYFNNKAIDIDVYYGRLEGLLTLARNNGGDMTKYTELHVTNDINPHDYFDYAAYKHILSMSFEGSLYRAMNERGCPPWLNEIFNKYGVYYELGDAWNLTVYPISDETEVDYTYYAKPKVRKYIYMGAANIPEQLKEIMNDWYLRAKSYGDIGSCVMGAGFSFTYNGDNYKMSSCSPWQGNCSWEHCVPEIKAMLEKIGCTNVYYEYGTLD